MFQATSSKNTGRFICNFLLFELQNESTFEHITDDELSSTRTVDIENNSFEIIPSR